MALRQYKSKRNFGDTTEPEGKVKRVKSEELIFVVQRHAASRLHYDFRLEMEGVLKSWAVPKGPSLDPKDKRLAMMVEDHPYEYKDFEGSIPKGNYGAGQVEIWDKGTYSPIKENKETDQKEVLRQLKEGSLKILMKGKKLRGEFALVKMKNTEDNAWLLIKHDDKYAESPYDAEENTAANSLVTRYLEEKKAQKAKSRSQPKA